MADLDKLTLRRATVEDQPLIKHMVAREAQLDPTALKWPHFVIAEIDGQAVGVGQIRPYPGCPELGSIYTRPAYRGQGVAAAIIRRLIADWPEPGPIFLECRGHMVSYYRRFGFEEVPWQEARGPLRLKACIGHFLSRLFGFKIAVMKLERDGSIPAPLERLE